MQTERNCSGGFVQSVQPALRRQSHIPLADTSRLCPKQHPTTRHDMITASMETRRCSNQPDTFLQPSSEARLFRAPIQRLTSLQIVTVSTYERLERVATTRWTIYNRGLCERVRVCLRLEDRRGATIVPSRQLKTAAWVTITTATAAPISLTHAARRARTSLDAAAAGCSGFETRRSIVGGEVGASRAFEHTHVGRAR